MIAVLTQSCAPDNAHVITNRELPEPPAKLLEPVAYPPARKGGDPAIYAVQATAAIREGNAKLKAIRAWYDGIRTQYRGNE